MKTRMTDEAKAVPYPLDIVVLSSDPGKTVPMSPLLFSQLVTRAGVPDDDIPLPVIPLGRGPRFCVITVPAALRRTVRVADALGIRFQCAHAARADQMITIVSTPEDWVLLAYLLPVPVAVWWLSWGVNWLFLDKPQLSSFFTVYPEAEKLYALVDEETALRQHPEISGNWEDDERDSNRVKTRISSTFQALGDVSERSQSFGGAMLRKYGTGKLTGPVDPPEATEEPLSSEEGAGDHPPKPEDSESRASEEDSEEPTDAGH